LRAQVLILSGNDPVDTAQQRRHGSTAAELDGHRRGAVAHAPVTQRLFAQRLARNCPREQTSAADLRFAFDHRGPKTGLRGLDRRGLAGGTRAHAHEVE
jgi:hypothetical protein